MKKVEKYFVRFLSPGLIVSDSWDQEVPVSFVPVDIVWPERAYAFRLFFRTEITDEQGKVYKSENERIGPLYYHPDSFTRTIDDIRATEGNSILVRNMEVNRWDKVVFTRWGNWPQPFEGCVILPKH